MSKGSKQRPGAGYAEGWDAIFRDPPPTPCECAGKGCPVCAPTEDGPGQDEARDVAKLQYDPRKHNREGV
jgi:hypothetical protein